MGLNIVKKRLFPGPEIQVNINSSEHLTVVGTADDFDFEYFMYSEAFETWIKQDIGLLKKYYSVNYEKLEKLAYKEIMRGAIQSALDNFNDEPAFA